MSSLLRFSRAMVLSTWAQATWFNVSSVMVNFVPGNQVAFHEKTMNATFLSVHTFLDMMLVTLHRKMITDGIRRLVFTILYVKLQILFA